MKILVFSDLHGSMKAARRILELARVHADAPVLLLGDMLYHGPRNVPPEEYDPRAVAGALAPIAPRVMAVKGNCDSEVDESLLPFALVPLFSWVLADAGRESRPLRILATHGHLYNPRNLPPLLPGDVLLFGHTHVPVAEFNAAGVALCNPGSLSLPKEGSPPCHGLFEDGVFHVLTDKGESYLSLDCRRPPPVKPGLLFTAVAVTANR